jgi:hypothetical protein
MPGRPLRVILRLHGIIFGSQEGESRRRTIELLCNDFCMQKALKSNRFPKWSVRNNDATHCRQSESSNRIRSLSSFGLLSCPLSYVLRGPPAIPQRLRVRQDGNPHGRNKWSLGSQGRNITISYEANIRHTMSQAVRCPRPISSGHLGSAGSMNGIRLKSVLWIMNRCARPQLVLSGRLNATRIPAAVPVPSKFVFLCKRQPKTQVQAVQDRSQNWQSDCEAASR